MPTPQESVAIPPAGFPFGQLPGAGDLAASIALCARAKSGQRTAACAAANINTVPGPGETEHVSCAVPCFIPEEAVMTTGPPTLTHVATPVVGSTVATVVSEDDHWALTFS